MLDLVIDDVLVVDGSGAPARSGAVGVRGDRIAWIGVDPEIPAPPAATTIAGRGRVLAPGFVDVHNHSDLAPITDPSMPSTFRQGVTTIVVGNCGASPWPVAGAAECAAILGADPASLDLDFPSFGDFLDRIDAAEPAVNVAALVGHGAVRAEVMGTARRAPTREELEAMCGLVGSAVRDGAVGLSTGLIYVPALWASTDEIVALAGACSAAGGIYASHIRGEGSTVFRAVDEAIEVGRRAGLPAHVSHLKLDGPAMWGRADELLERLHGADDVSSDQYPYTAWNSYLSTLLPEWVPARGLEQLLADPASRIRLEEAVEHGEDGTPAMAMDPFGWDRVVVESGADRAWGGRTLAQIAKDRGERPVDSLFALLLADPDTSCIGYGMSEPDVETILADPKVFVASDGWSMAPDGPLGELSVHPRNYGTFPRVLGRYVRSGTITLEVAIRKMTSLPAARFGLNDRGRIAEGAFADLVLFDRDRIVDTATFEDPHRFPDGIDLVMVNGRVAWDGAEGERAGRALRRR